MRDQEQAEAEFDASRCEYIVDVDSVVVCNVCGKPYTKDYRKCEAKA